MSVFERYFSVWLALCTIVGVTLGHFPSGLFHALGAAEIARVNRPSPRLCG
jgi:ACR3 family arsenite transporter